MEIIQKNAKESIILQEWKNEFVSWNASDYGQLEKIYIDPELVWHPNVEVENRYVSPQPSANIQYLCVGLYSNMSWRQWRLGAFTTQMAIAVCVLQLLNSVSIGAISRTGAYSDYVVKSRF